MKTFDEEQVNAIANAATSEILAMGNSAYRKVCYFVDEGCGDWHTEVVPEEEVSAIIAKHIRANAPALSPTTDDENE